MSEAKSAGTARIQLAPGRREHVFAIVRVDEFYPAESPVEKKIAITKVVQDELAAEREVQRLNALQSDKQVRYFMQVTRLEKKSVPRLEGQSQPGGTFQAVILHVQSLTRYVATVDTKWRDCNTEAQIRPSPGANRLRRAFRQLSEK